MTQCGSPGREFSDAVVVPRGRGVGRSVAAGCLVAAGADDPLGHHSGEVAAAATPATPTPRGTQERSPAQALVRGSPASPPVTSHADQDAAPGRRW